MSEGRQAIEDLAGAILDGAAIDWGSAESSAEIGDGSLLRQLRVVAAVVALHRRGPQSTGTAFSLPADVPQPQPTGPPIVDGKYQIERSLGQGGMGFVYCARHVDLNKRFALKLLQPHRAFSPDAIARFQVEAHALGRLNHPNIVQVTDFGVDRGVGPYLVMEYIARDDPARRGVAAHGDDRERACRDRLLSVGHGIRDGRSQTDRARSVSASAFGSGGRGYEGFEDGDRVLHGRPLRIRRDVRRHTGANGSGCTGEGRFASCRRFRRSSRLPRS